MKRAFLDTVGIIAVWDDTDQWHAAAQAAYAQLRATGYELVTTHLVLCECGNAAARRPYRADVNELRKAYDRGDAGQAGIVDQISFIVMWRLGIVEAFTNDRHFQAAGFVTLF